MGENDVKPSTYSDSCHSAVETVEASPGDGAGVEVDQLAVNGGEGHLDVLQIFQQKQDTAVAHCQGNGAVSTGAFPVASLTSSPGLQDTDLHTSCCLGRLPRGSHTHACRRHTASPSVRWSKCIPQCAGRRSPLCTRTLPSLRTGKRPWHHFVLSPPQTEGKELFYSSCAIASLLIYMPLLGISLCT